VAARGAFRVKLGLQMRDMPRLIGTRPAGGVRQAVKTGADARKGLRDALF
jgi:hypothetical protein